jgi:AhpD family alkylhydroperoxidase
MNDMKAVSHEQEIPDIFKAMIGVHQAIDAQGLQPGLRHLVHLRASQINRCAFCVKMHIREAREDGETNDRLDRVVVWDVVGDFSEKEQAALAWTEALSVLDAKTDYGALRARLRRHFSEQEIGALTATIAMVNAWNRINIARH